MSEGAQTEENSATIQEIAEGIIKKDQVVGYVRSHFEKGLPISGETVTEEKAKKVYIGYNLDDLVSNRESKLNFNKTIVINSNEGLFIDIHPLSQTSQPTQQEQAWVLHFAPGGANDVSQLSQKGFSEIGALVNGRKALRKVFSLLDSGLLPQPKYVFGGNTNPTMNKFLEEAGISEPLPIDPGFFSDKKIEKIELPKLRGFISKRTQK